MKDNIKDIFIVVLLIALFIAGLIIKDKNKNIARAKVAMIEGTIVMKEAVVMLKQYKTDLITDSNSILLEK